MALFGKNKKDIVGEEETLLDEEVQQDTAEPEEDTASAQERFNKACENISRCFRVLLPQQLYAGFFYAELQEGGYIDDFCCYASDGRFMERQEIPKLCGLSLPDMVAREEKLEQAFFQLRKCAQEVSGKPCSALSLTMLHNGQVKVDLVSGELKEGEEEKRYNAWRDKVEAADPKKARRSFSPEKLEEIKNRTREVNMKIGTEFYSMLPGDDFKIAYLYAENGENGIFYYQRFITNEGEILDNDELADRFGQDKQKLAEGRVEVVKLIMQMMHIFEEAGEKPFTSITLSVTGKGEFQCDLGFGATDAAGESARIEMWKEAHKG